MDEPRWFRSPGLDLPSLSPPSSHAIGGKGRGLLRLPVAWVPATLFLEGHTSATDLCTSARAAARSLPPEALSRVVSESAERVLLVRSSAVNESMRERGTFSSLEAPASVDGLAVILEEVWERAIRDGGLLTSERIGVIVQPKLVCALSGHLSNEYRVSRESRQWTSTIETPHFSQAQWRVQRALRVSESPLLCGLDHIDTALRTLATFHTQTDARFHLEWVWDGERVWAVQSDLVEETFGPPPGDAWAPTRGVGLEAASLKEFSYILPKKLGDFSSWPKVEAISRFGEAGLAVPKVCVLTGPAILEELASGHIRKELQGDIRLLASGHVVLRTDVRGQNPQFFLPKTGATCDAEEIGRFLTESAASLVQMTAPENVAFIAHRFLRARGSALSSARPDGALVNIDAGWGLPDGLNWLPHDSFIVDTQTGRINRSVLGKTNLFDVAPDESWTYRETPSRWIWKASLGDKQARMIAQGTARLAKMTGSPVLVMWFTDLLDGHTSPVLPWFMTNEEPFVPHVAKPQRGTASLHVRKRSDLAEAGAFVDGELKSLVLNPSASLIRDKRFIDEVADVALRLNLTVEIAGSPLAHVYYLLRKRGVAVITRTPEMGRRKFGKLVRDLIPEHVSSRGERATTYVAGRGERLVLLRQKLIEEAFEVHDAVPKDLMLEELADVEEVVDSILRELSLTRHELTTSKSAKREKRGGFEQGVVLIETSLSARSESDQAPLPGLESLPPVRSRRRVEREGSTFRVPVTPPGPMDLTEEAVDLDALGLVAHVRHTGRSIEIELTQAPREQAWPLPALFESMHRGENASD